MTQEQLRDLARYEASPAFDELERLVVALATAMASVPVEVPPALTAALRRHLSQGQLVELAAAIAWENYRARFNRCLAIRPAGFSEGAACALPASLSGGPAGHPDPGGAGKRASDPAQGRA